MSNECPVCADKDWNSEGFRMASEEVLPFVKNDLLHLRYPTHPIPLRFRSLTASLFAYSQALIHTRKHGYGSRKYATENEWIHKFAARFQERFPELIICYPHELSSIPQLVCEFNT